MEQIISAVGVLDKALTILYSIEERPKSLVELVEATGYSRATAHRLAGALELHGLLRRTAEGRYAMGFRVLSLGRSAERSFPLAESALPALEQLVATTAESAQLYVRDGERRVCVAAVESSHGLRTIVERGAALSLTAGSGGMALAATSDDDAWFDSVAQREPGVASVSAAVWIGGQVVAAVGVSGPIERLTSSPGELHGQAVVLAAKAISVASRS
ncbi:MAG: helix-turn-helix domain-containing protein [Acidimicrobiales bacterium]